METIGDGLNRLCLAPSKSGCIWPSAPSVTVHRPEGEGRNGRVTGGAGKVNTGSAEAGADRVRVTRSTAATRDAGGITTSLRDRHRTPGYKPAMQCATVTEREPKS